MKGNTGNKGGLAIRFLLRDSTFCFLSIHLTSGWHYNDERIEQMSYIIDNGFKVIYSYAIDFKTISNFRS